MFLPVPPWSELVPDSASFETRISDLERLKELDIEWKCSVHCAPCRPGIIESRIQFLNRDSEQ